MGEKKRILHLLASHVYGGAENVVCQIIQMFRDDPDVEMFYCSPDGTVRPSLEERKIDFHPVKTMSVSEVRRVIREVQPTFIHAHDMRASFLASMCCGSIPFISHIHNNNFDSRRITPKAIVYRFAAQRAEHIFWVSPSAFNGYRFHHALRDKSTMLRNVIDPEALRAKACAAEPEEPFDMVFLGRMTHPKNPTRLVEVMAGAAKQQPGLKAAIIGIGELEQDVRDAIARLNCGGSVQMLGFRSNPYGLLKNAKLMLMTSLWEGTPMCALESLALGTPIVSTPVDGLLDLVEPGKTGYLSADTDELIESCLKIIRDPALREEMSRCCTEKAAELLDVEKYKQAIWQAYCLKKHGGS